MDRKRWRLDIKEHVTRDLFDLDYFAAAIVSTKRTCMMRLHRLFALRACREFFRGKRKVRTAAAFV